MYIPCFIKVSNMCFGMVNTELSKNVKYRQIYGLGMEAYVLGKRAVERVQRDDFYIVTQPHNCDYIAR